MAIITIRRGDIEIDIRDSADLRSVLDALGERQLLLPLAPDGSAVRRHNPPAVDSTPTETAYHKFYELTKGKRMQSFVEALFQSPGGLSDTQVRNQLVLTDNSVLAGISAGIVKCERRAGLPDQSAVKREQKGSAGDYSYHYRLTRECRLALTSLMDATRHGTLQTQDGEAPV